MAAILGVRGADFRRGWSETHPARHSGRFATIRDNLVQICREAGVSADDAALDAAVAARERAMAARLGSPFADSIAGLAAVRAAGSKTGLVSNCTPEIPRLWATSPFAGLIDAPVFSPEAGMTKPDPAIYALACSALEVEAGHCLFVGDGESDELEGARRAGMQAAQILRPNRNLAYDANRPGPSWDGPVIKTLSGMFDLLR